MFFWSEDCRFLVIGVTAHLRKTCDGEQLSFFSPLPHEMHFFPNSTPNENVPRILLWAELWVFLLSTWMCLSLAVLLVTVSFNYQLAIFSDQGLCCQFIHVQTVCSSTKMAIRQPFFVYWTHGFFISSKLKRNKFADKRVKTFSALLTQGLSIFFTDLNDCR